MSGLRGLIAAGVRNPVYANVLMVCILVGGAVSSRALVTETYPEFSLDRISIEAIYPGASPEEVERGVCTKIEEAIEGLVGIKKTWSSSSENRGLVMVELLEGVADPRLTMLDIKDRVDRIETFPPEVERPVFEEVLIRDQVINVALYGRASERTLKEWAVEIKDDLLAGGLVSQVVLTGVRDYEIAIQVSREALLQYGLSLADVSAVVARNCLDVPAGTLRTDREELTLRTTGQRYTAREFEDLVVIARPDGTMIQLRQLATVSDGFADDPRSGRFQGHPAVVLQVFKTPAQDTATISAAVRDYVEQKQAELPSGLHLDVWGDAAREVDARIAMLLKNAAWGMVLVLVVLSLILDLRVAFFVAVGIPVSFAGALMVMHFTGQTLNMLTLFALIVVSGIIVDDAIVIADGFRYRVSQGDTPELAAVSGPRGVMLPVLGSSATTIAAFAPLMFVAGIMGKFVAVLPVVVISAVVFSAVEAFCILPAHLRHCLGPAETGGGTPRAWVEWRRRQRVRVEQAIDAVIQRAYRPFCGRALRARGVTVCVAAGCTILVGGLIGSGRLPFTLFPEIDGDLLRARVRFPQGVPLERTEAAVRQLEDAAEGLNDSSVLRHLGTGELVRRKHAVVGEWSGWVHRRGSHLCEVTLELMPAEERRLDSQAILTAWEAQTGVIDDVGAVTFRRVQSSPGEKPLDIRLLGDDLEQLGMAADDVCDKLEDYAGVSGIEHDLHAGRRRIDVTLKPLARTLGVTLEGLAQQLRSGFHGGEAVRVQRGRDEVRVHVRYPDEQRRSISDVENLRVRGAGGSEIPFGEVADYTISRGYTTIHHGGSERRVRVTADVDLRLTNSERILAELEASYLPELRARYPGIEVRIEGQRAQMLESLDSLAVGFGVALVVIYAILAALLGSYVQPLVIMVAIPLGFTGAAVGHLLLGYDLTILSVFGIVAMSGVVVNDALVLLDQINTRIRERLSTPGAPSLAAEDRHASAEASAEGWGTDPLPRTSAYQANSLVFDAVLDAGSQRFRAVVLTTITTVAGLAPLLLERSTQAQTLIPMAVALVFGLAFATVLTLVVVPALYLLVIDARRAGRWLRRGGEFPTAEVVVK
ncbi:MAG: efflux RND transporter permease subunit [bacterium]|nr:efflux RND transporter permease subunit [bacterium]